SDVRTASGRGDLNPRPPAPKAGALPLRHSPATRQVTARRHRWVPLYGARMQEQRRGRKIAMTPEECDEYLGSERTCTVATVSHDGPHVTALWFVWDGECAWLYSITRSQRWTDLERDARVAILVEAGEEYNELRGVEIHGTVEPIGEVPRAGEPV